MTDSGHAKKWLQSYTYMFNLQQQQYPLKSTNSCILSRGKTFSKLSAIGGPSSGSLVCCYSNHWAPVFDVIRMSHCHFTILTSQSSQHAREGACETDLQLFPNIHNLVQLSRLSCEQGRRDKKRSHWSRCVRGEWMHVRGFHIKAAHGRLFNSSCKIKSVYRIHKKKKKSHYVNRSCN